LFSYALTGVNNKLNSANNISILISLILKALG
jgi:hypothetical protein